MNLTFSELVIALATGKRVTHKTWGVDSYIQLKDGKIVSTTGKEFTFGRHSPYETDTLEGWKIHENVTFASLKIFQKFKYTGVLYIKVLSHNELNAINLLHDVPTRFFNDTIVVSE